MFKKLYLFLTLLTAFLWLGSGTMWGAQTILEEGFETATVEANGWTRVSCHSSSQNYSSAAHSGSKGFRFYYNSNPPQYLVSGELSVPANASALNVSFYYKNYSTSYPETFQVGYSTTTSETTAFTWDPTDSNITASDGAWHQYTNDAFPVGTKYIAIKYTASNQYYLFIDDLKVECSVSGPDMGVFDGETALTSGHTHSFGLATEGDTKTFTLKNDGTEATPVSVSHTGSFGASLSAASIPAGGEITLTVTMPASTGTDAITISSSSPAIEDFVLNVRGTIADPSKFSESLLVSSKPAEWTTSGTWSWSITNGASNTAWEESSNYRLITPKLVVAAGESFFFEAQGTYSGYQGVIFEYSDNGTTWTASSTTTTVSGSWQTFEINDVPEGNYYIAIHGWHVKVRNFYGGVLPNSPKNVQATNIVTEGATITWNPYGSETAWQVSYSTTSGDPANGTLVSANSTSKELTGLTTGTKYYVSVRLDNGNGTYGMWSEEINFTPTCPAPTSPAVNDITTTTATASWNAAAGITTYQYIVVEEGEEENWENPNSVNTTSTPLTGLTAETSYDFYVRSFYSEGKVSASAKTTFETACNPKSLPYTCGFESTDQGAFASNGSYNNCWKRIGSPAASNNSYYKHTGSKSLYFNGTSEQYAILPVFAQLVKGMQISFWYVNYYPGSYASTLTLGTMTDPTDASTFTTIRALDASSSYVNIVEESLAGAGASDYYIAFKYTGSNQYSGVYLDDITVEVLPSCAKPTGVAASNETGTTADIDWTSSASAWKLQYSTDGSNWIDANEGNNITSKPYTLTGLTPNKTTYYARVKAVCSELEASDWSNPSDPFQTECADITVDADHDWTENFNNQTVDELPACWTAAGNTSAVFVKSSSSYLTLSSKALYFSGSGGNEAIAILPDFTVDVNTLQIAFSHVEESKTSSGKVKFGYYKDATFTPLKTCDYSTSSSAWKEEAASSITGVPSGAKLAFAYTPITSAYTAAVDNIVISLAASCAVPSEVEGEGLSTTTASISWTAGGEETAWKLQYSTDGENWTDANEGNNITDNPYELSSLSAGTTYYARVKADCGGDLSDWSAASAGFKTDCNATNMPFEEAFDATLPDCWKMVTVGDNSWVASSSSYYRHSASYSWQYSAYASADDYSDLITPAIVLSEDALLKFYVSNYAYSGTNVVAEVYIQYGTTTTKIYDIPTISTGYSPEQQVVDLSTYTGQTAKFIFRAHGNGKTNYKYIYIDDVEVAAKPCDAPTALSKVESSSNVILSWTDEAASKWNLRWREVTEPESAWNDIEDLTAKTCTLAVADGLAFDKNYQAQVQAVCTDVKSSEWSDLISFGLVCGAAPTNLTVSARTTNSATLNWEGAESAFKLQTSLDGENWENPVAVNAKTYNLTELSAGQTYYVRVQNACGGDFVSTSFKTWCGLADAAELPLSEDFSSALPACWETVSTSAYPKVEAEQLSFVGKTEQMVVFPGYDIDLDKLTVKFNYYNGYARLKLGYLATAGGDFNELVVLPDKSSMFEYELDLATIPAAEGKKGYLAVVYYNATQTYYNAAIDNVYLRKTPTCQKPVITTPISADKTSAEIEWTNTNAAAWKLQYKVASASSWSDAIDVNENPYTLEGLAQGTTYKVRVAGACTDEDSDWSEEASFITGCETIDAIPFEESFDNALSACWIITDDNAAYYAHSVFNGALNLPGGRTNSGHMVQLPTFGADLSKATMTIKYGFANTPKAGVAQPQVGYIDGEGFHQLEALSKSANEAYVSLENAASNVLAIRYDDGTSEETFYINEIRVSRVEVFSDAEDNEDRLAALKAAGETIDVIFNRTLLGNGDYNTFCLPFSLDADQLAASPIANFKLKAYDYATIENEELLIAITNASSIEAGVPYLIANNDNGDNLTEQLFQNVVITAAAPGNVANGDLTFKGVFNPVNLVAQANDDAHNQLFLAAGNTIYWPAQNKTVKGFRAYFNITSGGPLNIKAGMPARIVERTNTTTGVDNLNTEAKAIKLLENGSVVIIRNGVKYTIQGQKIQ